jgi:hypothetical protein
MNARPPPPEGRRRSGFCAVRIDVERYGLLVTVCTNPDVANPVRDRVVKVGDVEAALAVVEPFLRGWVHRHGVDP